MPRPSFNEKNNVPPRHEVVQSAVGGILEDYSQRHIYLADAKEGLTTYYEANRMGEHFPELAAMQVTRGMRNIGLAVMKALADEELMRRLTPLLQNGGPLPASHSRLYAQGAGQEQKGEYDRFMRILTTNYVRATEALKRGGEYDGLWELLLAHENNYREAWRGYRDAAEKNGRPIRPPYEPPEQLGTTIIGGIGNNALTVQSVLLAHQREHSKQWNPESGEPYGVFLRRSALARTALLTLPASTNRSVTGRLVADPDTVQEEGVAVCHDPLQQTPTPDGLVRGKDGATHWDHKSLQEGKPWTSPGHCAGNILRAPTPGNEEIADLFFKVISGYSGDTKVRDEKGRFTSVIVAHCIGALVAERTLYKRILSSADIENDR
jgi:hypothetical protein